VESSVSGVGVLDKAMVVLEAVAVEPLGLAALCDATELPRATAYRLAVALESHGLVRRLDDGRFTLGLRLIGLGRAATTGFPLAVLARPILDWLRDETGESVQLYVAEGDARRCVVSLQSPHGLRWIVPEGVLLPMEKGSAGRALAGDVGKAGWAESVEERERGVCSVSAPIYAQDEGHGERIIGALSVSGPVERLTRSPGRKVGQAVVRASSQLRNELHHAIGTMGD
jgi:DNA-binding IclR family transcriptional regulator